MELVRGICNCCLSNAKVMKDSKLFVDVLPLVFGKIDIDQAYLQNIKNTIKICPTCCYKLDLLKNVQSSPDSQESVENSDEEIVTCIKCNASNDLVKAETTWKYLKERMENQCTIDDTKEVFVCLKCFYYLDLIYTIRKNVSAKFPISTRRGSLRNDQKVKLKSTKKSYNFLEGIVPLYKSKFILNETTKNDVRFYRQIPYVKLDPIKSEIASKKPPFKIRLKSRKTRRGNNKNKKTPSVKVSSQPVSEEESPSDLLVENDEEKKELEEQELKESAEEEFEIKRKRLSISDADDEKSPKHLKENEEDKSVSTISNKSRRKSMVLLMEPSLSTDDQNEDFPFNDKEIDKIVDKYVDPQDGLLEPENTPIVENGKSENNEETEKNSLTETNHSDLSKIDDSNATNKIEINDNIAIDPPEIEASENNQTETPEEPAIDDLNKIECQNEEDKKKKRVSFIDNEIND